MRISDKYLEYERAELNRARASLEAAERRIAAALININNLKRWQYKEETEDDA